MGANLGMFRPHRAKPGRRAVLAGVLACAATATPALGQAYPSRPLRIIVPWGPGGLVDTGGRIVGDALQKALGQAAAVENMPGAGGAIGANQVARATPDGHTLLMATSSLAIDVGGGRALPFDPVKDLAPVGLVADTHSVVVVPPNSPIASVTDLVAAAKAKPGGLSYGSPGIGSPAHLFGELFSQMVGVSMLHVPYGRADALNDVMGGRLAVMFATIPVSMPHIKNGNLRALAVTGPTRDPGLPQIPTVVEAGVADFTVGQWLGVFAPAKTPQPVIARLSEEIAKAVAVPETAATMRARGLVPRTATPQEFAAVLAADIKKWGSVIRTAKIELQ